MLDAADGVATSASAFDASAARGGNDELASAREELDDARSHYESRVHAEMARGRSVPTAAVAAAADGAADEATPPTGWNRSALSVTALQEAVEACEGFPRPSSATKTLIEMARLIVELRTLLTATSWADAASWRALSDFLDEGEMDVSAAERPSHSSANGMMVAC